MLEELSFFAVGAVFGIIAGITPGPFLFIIMSETLRHNYVEGIKVALAPIVTDLVLFLPATLLLLTALKDNAPVFGMLSIGGALFLCYLAYDNFTTKGFNVKPKKAGWNALKKGIIVDLLDPVPYFFWVSVWGPMLLKALDVSLLAAVLFVISLEGFAIGTMSGLALLTHHSKNFFKSERYLLVLKLLGVALLYFAWVLFTGGLAILAG